MMRKLAFLMILLLLLGCICGCGGGKNLQFYVIEGKFLTGGESEAQMLSLAKRKGRLVFSEEEMEGYLWAEHTIRLKEAPVRGSATDGGSRLFQAKPEDRFILALGNRVIYWGGFSAGTASASIQVSPYIADQGNQSFSILYDEKYSENPDPRGDQKLYAHLVERQLLSSALNEDDAKGDRS